MVHLIWNYGKGCTEIASLIRMSLLTKGEIIFEYLQLIHASNFFFQVDVLKNLDFL